MTELFEFAKANGTWAVCFFLLGAWIYKLSMKWSHRLLDEENGILTKVSNRHIQFIDSLEVIQDNILSESKGQNHSLTELAKHSLSTTDHLKENSDRMTKMCESIECLAKESKELKEQHNDHNSPFSTARMVKAIPPALRIAKKIADAVDTDISTDYQEISDHFKGI